MVHTYAATQQVHDVRLVLARGHNRRRWSSDSPQPAGMRTFPHLPVAVIPGNNQRSSIAAETSPRWWKTSRIAVACASVTQNMAGGWTCAAGNATHRHRLQGPRKRNSTARRLNRREIAALEQEQRAAHCPLGHRIGHNAVAGLLGELGYSLQSNRKTRESSNHPDRDAQFGYIDAQMSDALRRVSRRSRLTPRTRSLSATSSRALVRPRVLGKTNNAGKLPEDGHDWVRRTPELL